MKYSPATLALLEIAREVGATDYDVLSGAADTSKLARCRLPNGRPIAVQVNNQTARIWMLHEHLGTAVSGLGKREDYAAGRGRHHHLDQVREFVGRPLAKVTVSTGDMAAVRSALAAAGSRAAAA